MGVGPAGAWLKLDGCQLKCPNVFSLLEFLLRRWFFFVVGGCLTFGVGLLALGLCARFGVCLLVRGFWRLSFRIVSGCGFWLRRAAALAFRLGLWHLTFHVGISAFVFSAFVFFALCVWALCVWALCVLELCVWELCVWELCVWELCWLLALGFWLSAVAVGLFTLGGLFALAV